MAKYFLLIALLLFVTGCDSRKGVSVTKPGDTITEHNGIKFDMSQKQVEAMGFVCKPEEDRHHTTIAKCKHSKMTGTAFDYRTKNYRLSISTSGKVGVIFAEIVGMPYWEYNTSSQQLTQDLFSKIQKTFPIKADSRGVPGSYVNSEWNTRDGFKLSVIMFPGMSTVSSKSSTHMQISSPSFISIQKSPQIK